MNDETPLVRFDGVSKHYGSLTVLDKLDFEVRANEMVSIIGPSGSGKTTVLRMLMTLEQADEGVIYIDGPWPTVEAKSADQSQPSEK